jgi:hypothetical protein
LKKKVIGLIDGESGNIGSIKKAIKDTIKNKPYQLKVIKDDFNPMIFDKIVLDYFKLIRSIFDYVFDCFFN